MYYLRRVGLTLVTLWVIVTLTFVLMKTIPGDPFSDEQGMPKEILAALNKHYGLDQPLFNQYLGYLKSIVTWNLGPSFKYKSRTVNEIIKEGFPVSATLGLEAFFIALTFGIILGSYAAFHHKNWRDNLTMGITIIGISVPSFILATLLQYSLALKLGLFPIARWETFWHSILPALALAAMPTAFIARLIRSNMVEVLQKDYIKAAKAKGLSTIKIVTHHALRNAIIPVIAYLGQLAANILVGSFVIEKIFGIPGLGQWFVISVANRDYTVIMGTTIFYSIILLSSIFFVDILLSLIDPRIKLQESEKT